MKYKIQMNPKSFNRCKWTTFIFALLIGSNFPASSLADGRSSVDGLGMLDGTHSRANDINATGDVVGYIGFSTGGIQAFLWQADTGMLKLGTLGGATSDANGINDKGQIVGHSSTDTGDYRAFLWATANGMQDLGTLGGAYSFATDINSNGQIVGYAANEAGRQRAFLLKVGSGMRDLGTLGGNYSSARSINDSGQIVGQATTTAANHAFLWSDASGMADLGASGGASSYAYGINENDQVVGYFRDVFYQSHAFLWNSSLGMQDLGTLGGSSSSAYGINASDQIVGISSISTGENHAFLATNGVMHDLNDLGDADWEYTEAKAINDFAQIAGTGRHNGQTEAFRLTLHPDWEGGNGYWGDSAHWNFAAMGDFGITPGLPHDVVIGSFGGATVYGPANAQVNTLKIFGQGGQLSTLDLQYGSISTQVGTTLDTNGTLTGSGRLGGSLEIGAGGRIQVRNGQIMQLAGDVSNNEGGRIDVQASVGKAELEIGGKLTGSGSINLTNAELYAHEGIGLRGRMNITGSTAVSGIVDNQNGRVNISGINSPHAIFWDDFINNGTVTVSEGSTVTFFGTVDGAGAFIGGGAKQFAGGYTPGNSPAEVLLEGDVQFIFGKVELELGGLQPGVGHDKLIFSAPVVIGKDVGLDIVYWNGWSATIGDVYDLFDWSLGQSDTFANISLPSLASGLAWDASEIYSTGYLRVTSVPVPSAYLLMLSGMLGLLVFNHRRISNSLNF